MSRSKKKTPIGWLCSVRAGEMKEWKSKCNRHIRRLPIDEDLGNGNNYRRINDPWGSPADGKTRGGSEKYFRK